MLVINAKWVNDGLKEGLLDTARKSISFDSAKIPLFNHFKLCRNPSTAKIL